MQIKMANSEINSDVLSCGSDYEDSFIHEMLVKEAILLTNVSMPN
jgi:hypothetical protein